MEKNRSGINILGRQEAPLAIVPKQNMCMMSCIRREFWNKELHEVSSPLYLCANAQKRQSQKPTCSTASIKKSWEYNMKLVIYIAKRVAGLGFLPILCACSVAHADPAKRNWSQLPVIQMSGGLKVFWSVIGPTENAAHAYSRGFSPITVTMPFKDYQGGKRESIYKYVSEDGANPSSNPWHKPPFFEHVIRRDIDFAKPRGIYVHDTELAIEDAARAWERPDRRNDSGATNFPEFEKAYYREWASWFALPAKWTKERYPNVAVGVYGLQPFSRDYWGIAKNNADQIDEAHRKDSLIWRNVDPYVDFYTASIYVFYDNPGSFYYMAANVEENYRRTRAFGDKPVYAFVMMNLQGKTDDLPPDLVEAMAIIPYFSGARGITLWGYEPQLKPEDGPPYDQLPRFMRGLERVAGLSAKIGTAKLVFDDEAQALWKEKRPLIRRFVVSPSECVVMAINPWQGERDLSKAEVPCGRQKFSVAMTGKETTLVHIDGERITLH